MTCSPLFDPQTLDKMIMENPGAGGTAIPPPLWFELTRIDQMIDSYLFETRTHTHTRAHIMLEEVQQ